MDSRAGIRELKAQLSDYLRRVQAGETVIITLHGRPIGQIVPYGQSTEERLERLQTSGLIAWSGQPLAAQAPVAAARDRRSVAELLLEDRE